MSVEAVGILLRLVLAGKQHLAAHEFAVVQHRLAQPCGLFVVPVHHHALVAGVHVVVVDILLDVDDLAPQLALQLGILLLQQVVVFQVHHEQVPAGLQIRDPRLPEDVQDVHKPDVHVSQAVLERLVPEHTLGAHAVLQLVPGRLGIGMLILVALKYHRQHGAQCLGVALVLALPGQHVGLRVVVHHVRVLVADGIEHPGGGGLRSGLLAGGRLLAPDHVPVPQLPPPLLLHDPGLQVGLAPLVVLQGLDGPLHGLFVNGALPHDRGRFLSARRVVHRLRLAVHQPQLPGRRGQIVHNGLAQTVGRVHVQFRVPPLVYHAVKPPPHTDLRSTFPLVGGRLWGS